jgi:hypothetical protein
MNRELVDLTNLSYNTGQLQRLSILNTVLVNAGDSMEYNVRGIWRNTPLKRQLAVDARIDIATFFVPHRHVYGQDWIDFVSQGYDETVTLQTVNAGSGNEWSKFWAHPWIEAGAMPLWLIEGYCQIWNRFFRPPKQGIAERDYTFNPTGYDHWGFSTATLPTIWNTGHDTASYPSNDTIPSGAFTLTDLAQKSAEWESELQREWKDHYYRDFLQDIWGGKASVDADQRPSLLAHSTQYTTGIDVYATGSNIGAAQGRTEALIDHGFPRRFFGEHGCLWTVATVRYPPTHEEESHYLVQNSNPTYAEFTNDPNLAAKMPPVDVSAQDFFKGGSGGSSLGRIPFGQWHRYQPSLVHQDYDTANGFPFYNTIPANIEDAVLYPSDRFSGAFVNSGNLGHYQAHTRNSCKVWRVTASSGQSVFAGTEI